MSSQLDRELDRALDLDGYRAFVRELKQSEMVTMDAEIVTFEGYRPRFELTPYPGKPGWSVVKMVSRGGLVATTSAPGEPAELAATLRERARSPNDVLEILNEMGRALLEQAA